MQLPREPQLQRDCVTPIRLSRLITTALRSAYNHHRNFDVPSIDNCSRMCPILAPVQAVFLYYSPDCPNSPANAIQMHFVYPN